MQVAQMTFTSWTLNCRDQSFPTPRSFGRSFNRTKLVIANYFNSRSLITLALVSASRAAPICGVVRRGKTVFWGHRVYHIPRARYKRIARMRIPPSRVSQGRFFSFFSSSSIICRQRLKLCLRIIEEVVFLFAIAIAHICVRIVLLFFFLYFRFFF